MGKQVAEVERRLSAQITNVIRTAQDKGIIRDDVDAYSIAVLIQSTTIGLASVDLADDLMPNEESWTFLMHRVVDVFRAKPR